MINWNTITEQVDGIDTETVGIADVVAEVPHLFIRVTLNQYMHDYAEVGSEYGWNSVGNVDPEDTDADMQMHIIRGTAWGDYDGSFVGRVNHRYLTDNHASEIILVGRSTHDGMSVAIPALGRISTELADILVRLSDYPLIDDSLYSEIEQEAAEESWETYGEHDLCREVEAALDEDDLHWIDWRRVWVDAMADTGYYPEVENATDVRLWDAATLEAAIANVREVVTMAEGI